MDRGAWWATVHGVSKSCTGLKQLVVHICVSLQKAQLQNKGGEHQGRSKDFMPRSDVDSLEVKKVYSGRVEEGWSRAESRLEAWD